MRHFLRPALISTVLVTVLTAGPACADEVSDFTVTARVGSAGNLTVEENILVDYGKNQRHGLVRKIPTDFASDNAELELLAAESPPGTNCHKVVSQLNRSVQLKLGDPKVLISGKHTYKLKYIIKNPAKRGGDTLTYEWSPNGKNWHMPIKTMTVNITGASAALSKSLAVTRQDSLAAVTISGTTGNYTLKAHDLQPAQVVSLNITIPAQANQPNAVVTPAPTEEKPGFLQSLTKPDHNLQVVLWIVGIVGAVLVLTALLKSQSNCSCRCGPVCSCSCGCRKGCTCQSTSFKEEPVGTRRAGFGSGYNSYSNNDPYNYNDSYDSWSSSDSSSSSWSSSDSSSSSSDSGGSGDSGGGDSW
ncbi:MAG: DUF2207 domain-containing protein [Candidatus Melainabacteria bacterium]|nr:DUF2207 domain-containing protein [Candidatus Melainabacteria bacterium]